MKPHKIRHDLVRKFENSIQKKNRIHKPKKNACPCMVGCPPHSMKHKATFPWRRQDVIFFNEIKQNKKRRAEKLLDAPICACQITSASNELQRKQEPNITISFQWSSLRILEQSHKIAVNDSHGSLQLSATNLNGFELPTLLAIWKHLMCNNE